ncbi:MAG: glycosyltransferase family 39 protein [bacterium]|nr:glycosyltransferase family 39 protein [bacterium]
MKLSKNKLFYIFLAIYVLLFALVQFLRNQPGIDSMEAIMWGEIVEFGTNKHPPLSGWIMGGFFNLFGQNDHTAYFLGTISLAIGLFFVYKLAKFFMSEEKAACAAMIMPACFYYTYTAFIDNFNCNFVCIAIIPIIAYFYYKAIKENKIIDWVLLGITSGLGFLNKYQIIVLFAALFVHFIIFERKQFKQKGLYISILTAGIVVLPHIIWLIKHDFFTFAYMAMMSGEPVSNSAGAMFSFDRIYRPIRFTVDQILALSPCLGMYLILAYQAKNIQFKNTDATISDKVFVFCVACGIVLTQAIMGIFSTAYIHGIWGSIMVGFAGMGLFFFFPIKFNEKSYSFFFKMSCIVMFLWASAIAIFAVVQVKHNISYPHQSNLPVFHKLWAEKTNNAPLKYVGGHQDYIFQFRLYDKERPTIILDTYGYKNPWINHDDVIESGAMIFSRYPDNLEEWTRNLIYKLPEDYVITPAEYEYEIKNKFGKTKKYTVYYTIIPPKKNDL